MLTSRRTILKGLGGSLGGSLALPLLESMSYARQAQTSPPLRLLVVGNPFGMHPEHFFPTEFGKDYKISPTLKSLDWLQDRISIFSHTDHGMKSGHGRELAFLSGVLPETASSFPEKNMSIDQVVARQIGSQVRYASVHATLDCSIRLSWNANGVDIKPHTDVLSLYDFLFLNLTQKERVARQKLMQSNQSILDIVGDQLNSVRQKASSQDQHRLDQFSQSIRNLESNYAIRKAWIDREKPTYDLNRYSAQQPATLESKYDAVFDMIAYAFETDLTRVATVGFSAVTNFTELEGVNRGYHGCTHNGKQEDVVSELVGIESFQVRELSKCLKKLDSIQEPGSNGSLLDNTIVLLGSGMGYGGTHSNRNLPILLAGGGLKHVGHLDCRDSSGNNMPLCNLYLSVLQQFGVERDQFNTSTGTLDLGGITS